MAPFAAAQQHRDAAGPTPSRGTVAMWCLIAAESAIFSIFVVAYLYYLGQEVQRAQTQRSAGRPDILLDVPARIELHHLAGRARHRSWQDAAFRLWWSFTIVLGITFLVGTAREWHKLIIAIG